MQALTPETLAVPIAGLNLAQPTLGGELGARPTLLTFLRHLG